MLVTYVPAFSLWLPRLVGYTGMTLPAPALALATLAALPGDGRAGRATTRRGRRSASSTWASARSIARTRRSTPTTLLARDRALGHLRRARSKTPRAIEPLAAQDGLYTLLEKDRDGIDARASIGSGARDAVRRRGDARALVARFADPRDARS